MKTKFRPKSYVIKCSKFLDIYQTLKGKHYSQGHLQTTLLSYEEPRLWTLNRDNGTETLIFFPFMCSVFMCSVFPRAINLYPFYLMCRKANRKSVVSLILDWSISNRRGVCLVFIPVFHRNSLFNANSVDPDQMLHSGSSVSLMGI